MINIEPIPSTTPIAKPVKNHRDEDRKNNQNANSQSEKKQEQLDEDAGYVQHIDEVV
ncbi:MAG: hypothetical protein K9L22_08045 [Methylococcaceae bacterium]|nr:hypothetical protein [Methylococcaceae bacterium]